VALNHETAGSTPARSTPGPIAYGLGSGISSPGTGFDSPWGYCGVEEFGCPQRPHKPKIMGSNPISATQSGVVQRQDAAPLRRLLGFESLHRSAEQARRRSLSAFGNRGLATPKYRRYDSRTMVL
jgi:hypothetical protein